MERRAINPIPDSWVAKHNERVFGILFRDQVDQFIKEIEGDEE